MEQRAMNLQLFKALADDTRLRIVHILFKNELSVNELVQILGMGQSRVSRHLKILAEAGILQARRDGLWVFYSTPEIGPVADFLRAIMPFMPNNAQMKQDLEEAAKKLEERARKTRQFFNNIAEHWDDLNHDILGEFDLAAEVAASMPPDCQTAVDLGCGTGEVLERLLTRSFRVIGVDGSAKMLSLCRSRLAQYEQTGALSLRIGELSHLPLADQEADFACVNLVLHHLPRPYDIFPEIRRILLPGSLLFVADFLRHDDETMRAHYGDHWLGMDPQRITQVLTKNGFKPQPLQLRRVGRNLSLFIIQALKEDALTA